MLIKKLMLATAICAVTMPVFADGMVKNYIGSKEGVIKNGYGECWRTSYKDTSDKKVECGYPAPVVEKVAAPIVITEEVVAADTAASVTTTVNDVISVSAAVLFGFDSAELSDDGKAIINERIQKYQGHTQKTADVKVVGYTDSSGPEAYNLKLSQRRADAVAEYLDKHTRVPDDEIESVGRGEENPIADNSTREGRALNRRVVIHYQGVIK